MTVAQYAMQLQAIRTEEALEALNASAPTDHDHELRLARYHAEHMIEDILAHTLTVQEAAGDE